MNTVILGLGNLLLGDEGVGVHAARALMLADLPPHVAVLDVGTAILDALPALETARKVIVIDCVKADEAPGSVYFVPYEQMLKPECIASLHGFDLSRVLALAGRTDLPEVVVFGVEPGGIDWSLELSPEVAEALPVVIEAVKREVMAEAA